MNDQDSNLSPDDRDFLKDDHSLYIEEFEQILCMKLDTLLDCKIDEDKVSILCDFLLKITEKYAINLIDRYNTINSSYITHFMPDSKSTNQNINIFIPYGLYPSQNTPQFNNPTATPIINSMFLPQYIQSGYPNANYSIYTLKKSKKSKKHEKKKKNSKKDSKREKSKKQKSDQIPKEKVGKSKTKKSKTNPKPDETIIDVPKILGSGIIKYFDQKRAQTRDQNSIQIYRNICCSFPKSFIHIMKNSKMGQSYQYYEQIKDDKWIIFDFNKNMIEISNYSIKSSTYPVNCTHLKNWSIDISDDGRNWETIDRRMDCPDLNYPRAERFFDVQPNRFARYVRLMNRGDFYGSERWSLEIGFIEFYGRIKSPKNI